MTAAKGLMEAAPSRTQAVRPEHCCLPWWLQGMLLQALLSLGSSAAVFLMYTLTLVVRTSPWWQPQALLLSPRLSCLQGICVLWFKDSGTVCWKFHYSSGLLQYLCHGSLGMPAQTDVLTKSGARS